MRSYLCIDAPKCFLCQQPYLSKRKSENICNALTVDMYCYTKVKIVGSFSGIKVALFIAVPDWFLISQRNKCEGWNISWSCSSNAANIYELPVIIG